MKVKNIDNLAGSLQNKFLFQRAHVSQSYDSMSNRFGVTTPRRYFKQLTEEIKVNND